MCRDGGEQNRQYGLPPILTKTQPTKAGPFAPRVKDARLGPRDNAARS
jgi:hypothetical protein